MVSCWMRRLARETSQLSGVAVPSTTISPRPQVPWIMTQLERRSTGCREKATPAALACTILRQHMPMLVASSG